MTRKECLEQAMGCVMRDRNSTYGKPEDCFDMIAGLWTAYLGEWITALDVSMMMALLKIARAKANPQHGDNFVDLAGYAACGAECADALKAREDAVHETGEECRRLREQEPEFKPGDKVQVRMPAADGDRWDDAVCVSVLPEGTGLRVDCGDYRAVAFGWHNIRHAPKAEGCEEPAYNPDNDVVGGVVTLAWPRGKLLEKRYASGRDEKCAEGCEELVQKDAPQTPEETCQRIVDVNPATYNPRTPTGEELAEMAEEETHE